MTTPRMHFLGVPVKTKTRDESWIMVDAKLNGMAHVAYIMESIAHYARSIHSLSRRDWGLGLEVLTQLYKLEMKRLSNYACSFIWAGTNQMRKKLVSAHKPVVLQITRCFRTTSTAAVQVLAGTVALDLQVEKECLLARNLRMNRDIDLGPVHICAYEVQRKAERWKVHPAKVPSTDRGKYLSLLRAPQNTG